MVLGLVGLLSSISHAEMTANGSIPVNGQWSDPSYAGTGYNPNGKPMSGDLNSYGKTAGGIAGGIMSQYEAPELSPATSKQEMADKFNQSGNQANAGSIAAGAISAAMLGRGIPMTLSPILPTQIAGWQLVAMGTAEGIQSLVSGLGSGANQGRKDYLRRTDNDTGSQLKDILAKVDPSQAISPEVEKLLREKNIDPKDFANKVMNQELNDPKDIAKYFGVEGEVTPEVLEQANGFKDDFVSDLFAKRDTESLKLDEAQKQSLIPETKSGEAALTSVGNGPANGVAALPGRGVASVDSTLSSIKSGAAAAASGKAGVVPPSVPLDAPTWNGLMHEFGVPGDLATYEKKAMIEGKLEKIGVELPSRGTTIFEKAKRRYQKYNQWRKESSVAAR